MHFFQHDALLPRGFNDLKHHTQVNSSPTPPAQNGRHLANDISEYIFVNEKLWILVKYSRKFVTKGPIGNKRTLHGLDNGLAPNGRQAIIWTNGDQLHWCI